MSKLINIYRETSTAFFLVAAGLVLCLLWPMSVSAQRSNLQAPDALGHCGSFFKSGAGYSPQAGSDVCPEWIINSNGSGENIGTRGGSGPFIPLMPVLNSSARGPIDILGDVEARLKTLQLNGLGDGGVKPGVSQNVGSGQDVAPVHSDPIPPAVSYTNTNSRQGDDLAAIRALLEEVLKRIIQLTSR